MTKKYILFTILGAVIALTSVWAIDRIRGGNREVVAPSGQEQRKAGGNNAPSNIEDNDPVKGSPDAPVTIVEFSDFQCPFCANFYSQTLSRIEQEYINTGKAKLVYRDFPLSFHQYAQKAAEASECADEQGKFWEYHNILFERQSEWSSGGVAKLKSYAGELGLDQGKFDNCLDSDQMAQEVLDDFTAGRNYGVTGTPAFFINGELVSGAQPFEVFKQAIEKAL